MSKGYIAVVLQPYRGDIGMDKHKPEASAICRNWRDVRSLLREDYRGAKVKCYRRKWSLPYKDFWVKSERKQIAEGMKLLALSTE